MSKFVVETDDDLPTFLGVEEGEDEIPDEPPEDAMTEDELREVLDMLEEMHADEPTVQKVARTLRVLLLEE